MFEILHNKKFKTVKLGRALEIWTITSLHFVDEKKQSREVKWPSPSHRLAAEPGAKILNSQLWACSPPHQRPQAGVDSSGHSPHYSSGSSSSQRRREGLAQAGKAPGEYSLTAVTLSPGECGDSAGLAGGGTGSRLSSREQVVEPLLWKPVSTSIKAYPVLGESNELRANPCWKR